MALLDVISATYDRLWAIWEADPAFTSVVKVANRVKFSGTSSAIVRKPQKIETDFPEAVLTIKGGVYRLATNETTFCNEQGDKQPTAFFRVDYVVTLTSQKQRIGTPDLLLVTMLDDVRTAGQRLLLAGSPAPFVTAVGNGTSEPRGPDITWTTRETNRDEAAGTMRLQSILTLPVTHTFNPGDNL